MDSRGEGERPVRCRLGLHRWAQFKHEDPDLEVPDAEVVWLTRCRDCGVERGSGVKFMLGLTGTLAIGGVVLWLCVSPVLGEVLFLGAVLGVGLVAEMTWLGTYTRRVKFRYRR